MADYGHDADWITRWVIRSGDGLRMRYYLFEDTVIELFFADFIAKILDRARSNGRIYKSAMLSGNCKIAQRWLAAAVENQSDILPNKPPSRNL
jgi:hypothetical protein